MGYICSEYLCIMDLNYNCSYIATNQTFVYQSTLQCYSCLVVIEIYNLKCKHSYNAYGL